MANSRICVVDGCGKPHEARGYCQGHYVRWKTHGDPLHGGVALVKRRAICSVDGCNRKHVAQGYCGGHYQRFRSAGNAGSADIRPYGEALQWLVDHANYQGSECLIWPFSRNDMGYAQLNIGGRPERGHRRMCIIVNGPAPFRNANACHKCGNGHLGCVHPGHLYWGTQKQNQQDMVDHGRSNRGKLSPLSEADVLAICAALAHGDSQSKIARQYSVSPSTISSIANGTNWGWLTGRGS